MSSSDQAENQSMSPGRILAVDDETVSRLVLCRMLDALGYEVVEACDVAEGIQKLEDERFDLVVSDYQMPGGTGLDVARVANQKATPFILLSGYSYRPDDEAESSELICAHLTKPVSSMELAEAIAGCSKGLAGSDETGTALDPVHAPTPDDHTRWLLEAIGVEVTLIDREARVIMSTAGSRMALGFDEEFWATSNLFDLAHPDDLGAAHEALIRLLEAPGQSDTARFRARHQDGSWETVEIHGTNLLDDPRVGALVLTTRSVTEEERLKDDYDRSVERAMSQAEYVASVSHELRTPLQGILGVAQLLEEQVAGEAIELVGIIRGEAERLRRIIDDILDYAKADTGAMELALAPASVREVISHVVDIGRRQLADGVELEVHVGDDVPTWVEIDELRVHQILLNLLANAVRFTEHGRITVTCRRLDGDRLYFAVDDTGLGIDPARVDSLFKPFQQGQQSPVGGGTGLGLAICTNLIGLMGGRLEVDSEPGTGSKFSFAIHAPPSTVAVPEAVQDEELTVAEVRGGAGGPATALVIDDAEVNRLVIGRQLETMGFQVDTADSGRLGLEMAIAGHYQVIVTDWHMPEMDGLEVIQRLRASEAECGRRTPIITMTASAMAADKDRCIEAGTDGFLAKPATAEELRKVVSRHVMLDRSKQPVSTAAGSGAAEPVLESPGDTELPESVVDIDVLDDLVSQLGGRPIVTTVVETFLSDLHERGDAIGQALVAGDAHAARRAAHTLKSPSLMLGATRLGSYCQAIEETEGAINADLYLEALQQAVQRTHIELERWIAGSNEEMS